MTEHNKAHARACNRDIGDRGFLKVPWGLIRDDTVSPAARCYLMIVASHKDQWNIRDKAAGEGLGLSRDGFKRMLAELKAAGYYRSVMVRDEHGRVVRNVRQFTLVPWQWPVEGEPAGPEDMTGGQETPPSGEDRRPVKTAVRCGPPSGADRNAVTTGGRSTAPPCKKNIRNRKNIQETEKSRTTGHRPELSYVSRLAAATTPTHTAADASPSTVQEAAEANDKLLGWICSGAAPDLVDVMADGFDGEGIEDIEAIASDGQMVANLRLATGGRIHRDLLTPPGLYAVRWLAAWLLYGTSELYAFVRTPNSALTILLNAVWDRIGSRPGQWLNSLALIGTRLMMEGYQGGAAAFVGIGKHPVWDLTPSAKAKRPKKAPDAILQRVLAADGAKALGPHLRTDAAGFRAYLRNHGGEVALDVICHTLTRAMVDGIAPHSIVTWSYFSAAIEDERHRRRLAAESIRPGDVSGLHSKPF